MDSPVVTPQHEIRETIFSKISPEEMGRIYASPSGRAIYTARALSEDIAADPRLSEIDFGLFDGMTLNEIRLNYPDEFECWAHAKEDYCFPNGERADDFFNRVRQGFSEIISHNPNNNITLVTHGGVIQAIISYLLKGDNSLFWNFKIDNCSITSLTMNEMNVIFNKVNW